MIENFQKNPSLRVNPLAFVLEVLVLVAGRVFVGRHYQSYLV